MNASSRCSLYLGSTVPSPGGIVRKGRGLWEWHSAFEIHSRADRQSRARNTPQIG
ncbi:hypothetical protein [Oxynema aestuarii]|uniref:Uncharacterized protein n=1 Tax=Oxynema aestuarii AP17 TaxID=2064643 RepID=A0A6H1U3I9_9CYAN|nr:hypothetical protein [Oxynema aestuarii]QIZ73404.1 hypothetical protein HCG48_24690 [Oxynema aestuarii AP17]